MAKKEITPSMDYSYKKKIPLPFGAAVERTRAALASEGLGVLTEVDVKATLKAKLDADWDNYLILGACNPPLALQALQAEKEIGLLMPCNVIVFEENGKVFVSAIMPTIAMNMIDNPELAKIAKEAEEKLIRVIDKINP